MENNFEKIISDLTKNFEERIPDTEPEKSELVQGFKNYLNSTVTTIQESNSKFISKDPNAIIRVLNRTAKRFSNFNLNFLKHELIIDNSLESLRKKSLEIFDLAKNKMEGKYENVEIDTESTIEEMKKLIESVKDYNKDIAKKLLSEAVVDNHYLKTPNCEVTSLRLSHFKDSISTKEER